jgi:hypothetical protein
MNKYKTLEEFLSDQAPDKKAQITALRGYILESAPTLEEHIKWNAPSYILAGEDRITFNVVNKEGLVKLVFHMGATRQEDKKGEPVLKNAPLIEWVSDIRGYATFNDLSQIIDQKTAIVDTVKRWLATG